MRLQVFSSIVYVRWHSARHVGKNIMNRSSDNKTINDEKF